jgi:hypothetical protein
MIIAVAGGALDGNYRVQGAGNGNFSHEATEGTAYLQFSVLQVKAVLRAAGKQFSRAPVGPP